MAGKYNKNVITTPKQCFDEIKFYILIKYYLLCVFRTPIVGSTSGWQYLRWDNFGPTYIAVWVHSKQTLEYGNDHIHFNEYVGDITIIGYCCKKYVTILVWNNPCTPGIDASPLYTWVNRVSIASDTGLSPIRRQAII